MLKEMNASAHIFTNEFYSKATLEATLGEKAEAVISLEQFLEKGGMYASTLFKWDVLLKPLFGYPPFEELVKPKG